MQVFIQQINGVTSIITVQSLQNIQALKMLIEEKVGLPQSMQRLVYKSKDLENSRLICDYGITHNSTIQLLLKLKGGMGSTGSKENKPRDVMDIFFVNNIQHAHNSTS